MSSINFKQTSGKTSTNEMFDETPKNLLIVDSDKAVHITVSEAVDKKFPYVNFSYATNSDEAWSLVQNKKFDFLVFDWHIKGSISGVALLNRLRNHQFYRHVPIVITSSIMEEKDISLLNEFSYTGLLMKPFRSQLLVRTVKEVFKEARWFFSQIEFLNSFIEDISNNVEEDRIEKILGHFLENCPRPIPTLTLCARFLREQEDFFTACRVAEKALELSPGSFGVECELSKIYLQMGDLEKAEIFLKRCNERSPRNLDRICDLGKLHLENLETEEASHTFQKALDIDPQFNEAQNGLKMAKNLDMFFKFNNPSSIPDTFAGLLNAIGIGHIRSGDLNKGIEHYQSALDYIYDSHIKAVVCFNLGLGYMRFSDTSHAEEWFSKSLSYDPEYHKSIACLTKLQQGQNSSSHGNVIYSDESVPRETTDGQEDFADETFGKLA